MTKTAVGMVELFPSLLLNLASGPQIAVMKTATHMAVIASDAHISGMSRSDHHRGRSCTTREGSCDIVDIFDPPFARLILTQRGLGVMSVGPDVDSVSSAHWRRPGPASRESQAKPLAAARPRIRLDWIEEECVFLPEMDANQCVEPIQELLQKVGVADVGIADLGHPAADRQSVCWRWSSTCWGILVGTRNARQLEAAPLCPTRLVCSSNPSSRRSRGGGPRRLSLHPREDARYVQRRDQTERATRTTLGHDHVRHLVLNHQLDYPL